MGEVLMLSHVASLDNYTLKSLKLCTCAVYIFEGNSDRKTVSQNCVLSMSHRFLNLHFTLHSLSCVDLYVEDKNTIWCICKCK